MKSTPNVPELVGVAEIATLLKMRTRQHAHATTRTKGFPEPTARLAAGPVWVKADVERWARLHRRGWNESGLGAVTGEEDATSPTATSSARLPDPMGTMVYAGRNRYGNWTVWAYVHPAVFDGLGITDICRVAVWEPWDTDAHNAFVREFVKDPVPR